MPSHSTAEQPEIPFSVDRFENESWKLKTRRNSIGGKESVIPWKQHNQNILMCLPVSVKQVYKQSKQPTAWKNQYPMN